MTAKATSIEQAWAVRPYPHDKYRMKEFREKGIAAIGWPAVGDLTGRDREQIRTVLREHYPDYCQTGSSRSLGQAVGTVDRFVNQIKKGHGIVIPAAGEVYVGVVSSEYRFVPELQPDDEGYPHHVGVTYSFDANPIPRSALPAVLFDSLKGRQTAFSVPAHDVADVINRPERYSPVSVDLADEQLKVEYCERLAKGQIPGINSPSFEEAVRKVLAIYPLCQRSCRVS